MERFIDGKGASEMDGRDAGAGRLDSMSWAAGLFDQVEVPRWMEGVCQYTEHRKRCFLIY